MSKLSKLSSLYYCWLAKPAGDRVVYRTIKKLQPSSIVEFDLGTGDRCQYLIKMAKSVSDAPIRYTGIDLFDGRDDSVSTLKLLQVHQALSKVDAKTKTHPACVAS